MNINIEPISFAVIKYTPEDEISFITIKTKLIDNSNQSIILKPINTQKYQRVKVPICGDEFRLLNNTRDIKKGKIHKIYWKDNNKELIDIDYRSDADNKDTKQRAYEEKGKIKEREILDNIKESDDMNDLLKYLKLP